MDAERVAKLLTEQKHLAVKLLEGRTLDRADAELIIDLHQSLAWARSIFDSIMADTAIWRGFGLKSQEIGEQIELFMEDEAAQTELNWFFEDED